MVKITILNDTRNSKKDIFGNDDGFSAYIEVNNNKYEIYSPSSLRLSTNNSQFTSVLFKSISSISVE